MTIEFADTVEKYFLSSTLIQLSVNVFRAEKKNSNNIQQCPRGGNVTFNEDVMRVVFDQVVAREKFAACLRDPLYIIRVSACYRLIEKIGNEED